MKGFVLRMNGDCLVLKADRKYFDTNPNECLRELDALALKKGFGMHSHYRIALADLDNMTVAFEYRHQSELKTEKG